MLLLYFYNIGKHKIKSLLKDCDSQQQCIFKQFCTPLYQTHGNSI